MKKAKKYNEINYYKKFPTILRNLLDEQKICTQQELGNYVNVTRQSISLYKNGDVFPDINIFLKIVDFFKKEKNIDYSCDYWLGLAEEPSTDIEIKEINKQYGLTKKSLDTIKWIAGENNGNYVFNNFISNISSEFFSSLILYFDITSMGQKVQWLLAIMQLRDLIKKLVLQDEVEKLKNYFHNYDSVIKETIKQAKKCTTKLFSLEIFKKNIEDGLNDNYENLKNEIFNKSNDKNFNKIFDKYIDSLENLNFILDILQRQYENIIFDCLNGFLSEHFIHNIHNKEKYQKEEQNQKIELQRYFGKNIFKEGESNECKGTGKK